MKSSCCFVLKDVKQFDLHACVCVDETVLLFILTMKGGKSSCDHTSINADEKYADGTINTLNNDKSF